MATSATATKMWSRVAAQLNGRTGKQCRERWLNQLKPGIRRGAWTAEEERILHEVHAQLGNKWVAIAERLPGRTDNCVKNHWNSMLRKRQRREGASRADAGYGVRLVRQCAVPGSYGIVLGHTSASAMASSSLPSTVMRQTSSVGDRTPSRPSTPVRSAKLCISNLVSGTQGQDDGVQNTSQYQEGAVSGYPSVGKAGDEPAELPPGCAYTLGPPSPVTPGGLVRSTSRAESDHLVWTPLSTTGDYDSLHTHGSCREMSELSHPLHVSLDPGEVIRVEEVQRKRMRYSTDADCNRRGSPGDNSLAALATVACNIPPSPLTPESRPSYTTHSHSRSASPSPLGRTLFSGSSSEMSRAHDVPTDAMLHMHFSSLHAPRSAPH